MILKFGVSQSKTRTLPYKTWGSGGYHFVSIAHSISSSSCIWNATASSSPEDSTLGAITLRVITHKLFFIVSIFLYLLIHSHMNHYMFHFIDVALLSTIRLDCLRPLTIQSLTFLVLCHIVLAVSYSSDPNILCNTEN